MFNKTQIDLLIGISTTLLVANVAIEALADFLATSPSTATKTYITVKICFALDDP